MSDFVDGLYASASLLRFAVRLCGLRAVPRTLRVLWESRAFFFGPLDTRRTGEP